MDGGGWEMSFFLFGKHDEGLRLKSFSASSRGGKSLIKIELEAADPYDLAWALKSLAEVEKGQRTKPKPEPKAKPLALPAPTDRGL